eukprot:TRINITY_DN5280_c0_g1_i1.p1 TRINITY_DN5280_c0_g1~~TRINITY_DN5280_c0_g1_i1.p1  ORF type:complete len:193 (+),score=52.30 TRINITY_DN5280_c0_g1_i1:74-580(+)
MTTAGDNQVLLPVDSAGVAYSSSEASPSRWAAVNPFRRPPLTRKSKERGWLNLPLEDKRAFVLFAVCIATIALGVVAFFAGGFGIFSFLIGGGSIVISLFGFAGAYFLLSFALFLAVWGFLIMAVLFCVMMMFFHSTFEVIVYASSAILDVIAALLCFCMRNYSLRAC